MPFSLLNQIKISSGSLNCTLMDVHTAQKLGGAPPPPDDPQDDIDDDTIDSFEESGDQGVEGHPTHDCLLNITEIVIGSVNLLSSTRSPRKNTL